MCFRGYISYIDYVQLPPYLDLYHELNKNVRCYFECREKISFFKDEV